MICLLVFHYNLDVSQQIINVNLRAASFFTMTWRTALGLILNLIFRRVTVVLSGFHPPIRWYATCSPALMSIGIRWWGFGWCAFIALRDSQCGRARRCLVVTSFSSTMKSWWRSTKCWKRGPKCMRFTMPPNRYVDIIWNYVKLYWIWFADDWKYLNIYY